MISFSADKLELAKSITALSVGVGAIIAAWYSGQAKLKKSYNDNGYEKRKNTISKEDYDRCQKERKAVEDRLFKGQEKLEDKIETMRVENKQDFNRMFNKIDSFKEMML